MSKTLFELPIVLSGGLGGGGDVIDDGEGSGQGTIDPVSWSVWQERYNVDMDHDGDVDEYDYYLWWIENSFTQEQWNSANNGISFPPTNQTP